MHIAYSCQECGKTYEMDEPGFRCACGGLLDLTPFVPSFAPRAEASLFRYAEALPLPERAWRDVTMGEGLTPLVTLDPGDLRVLVKVDYAMPTLSFKDRGAVMVVAQAKAVKARRIVQDSSGNAGASVAAYATRAGIPCEIFVPQGTSARKIAQITAYGALVREIPGTREDTAAAALEAAQASEVFYASHVYNPLFHQGTKTYIYELFEALGRRLPDALIVPTGNGTLLLGVAQGLQELRKLGLITSLPRVLAVQAEGCAPIYRAFHAGEREVTPGVNEGTAAEGIAIAAPMRGTQILQALRDLDADVICAPESAIADAKLDLARRGFFVETTTAANWAACRAWLKTAPPDVSVVLPLCGAGLKGC